MKFGISGLSTTGNIRAACGVAGLDTSGARMLAAAVPDLHALKERDALVHTGIERMGDRAARSAWGKGVWFADFAYITAKEGGGIRWREGRDKTLARPHRALPLFIDSCGYRREITGTAPKWAHEFAVYPQALELLDPDGYAAWDYPHDRQASMESLRELMRLFPQDVSNGKLWPVFSVRWTFDDRAHLDLARLPAWRGRELATLIPLTGTQKPFKRETREEWARLAIANALRMGSDPDFKWMCQTFGRVMIGGLVMSQVPRMARHLLAAALCHLYPEVQFWLLGQANFAVINGLGSLGLLEQVWTDGSWYIKDATAERFAVVENGLITMYEASRERMRNRHTFFTFHELLAANLRSLLAAYQGLWSWPPPEPLPLDLLDPEQVGEMKQRLQVAQMELGL